MNNSHRKCNPWWELPKHKYATYRCNSKGLLFMPVTVAYTNFSNIYIEYEANGYMFKCGELKDRENLLEYDRETEYHETFLWHNKILYL